MAHLTEKQLVEKINRAIKNFSGDMGELESAIGALFVGLRFGWRPLFLIHLKKTIRNYEKILDINFREVMPEVGPLAKKSVAWLGVEKVTNFWKAVKGEIPGARSSEVK